jgi:glucosamine-6-phosphate deaminase
VGGWGATGRGAAGHGSQAGEAENCAQIPTYEALVGYVATGALSFKHVVTFNMDEWVRDTSHTELGSVRQVHWAPTPVSARGCGHNGCCRYVGLPVGHPESYHSFMHTHLFDHVDMQVRAAMY